MKWCFGQYSLDAKLAELSGPDGPVHIERAPLNVLVHLIENKDRVVTKDDLIEAVWGGRIVSESAVSTAIKQARKATGDTGSRQSVIRTVHGRGFRFVAPLEAAKVVSATFAAATDTPLQPDQDAQKHGRGQPSIAVLRFGQLGDNPIGAQLAISFPAELITALSRLSWLQVIARGSSFLFDPEAIDTKELKARLNVRYILTGLIEPRDHDFKLTLEIQSTLDGSVVWSDSRSIPLAEIQIGRQSVVAEVVSVLELAVPKFEAMHSRKLNEDQFDAWSHFHLGLTHIFRFNQKDNDLAAKHFDAALDKDPEFARAHAGASFSHWQTAFMRFGEDDSGHLQAALTSAKTALAIDPSDPFSNFCMGRAQWLEGDTGAGLAFVERALVVNPNYAQCHYTKGLLLAIEGDYSASEMISKKAVQLSPLDPLLYGMLTLQSVNKIAMGEFEQAHLLAERAAKSPGSHYYAYLYAAVAAELSGDRIAMEKWRKLTVTHWPQASSAKFVQTFPWTDPQLRGAIVGSMRRMGLE